MVKASELTNKQLVAQIEKYEKIVKGLHREREKRVAANTPAEDLMTERDKKLLKREEITQTDAFTVEISMEDIESVAEVDDASSVDHEDKEDLMRVTRLLQLSKSDLEELNKEKHRAQAKEKAEVLKQRRKKKVSE